MEINEIVNLNKRMDSRDIMNLSESGEVIPIIVIFSHIQEKLRPLVRALQTITGECQTQQFLIDHEGPKAPPLSCGATLVRSLGDDPVVRLHRLLIALAKAKQDIHLHIMDSFWSKDVILTDCSRLEPFLSAGYGSSLKTFFGHVEPCTLAKMTSFSTLGLRLESAEDVATLNSVKCNDKHVAVSRSLKPEDILLPLNSLVKLHCVELEDREVPWLLDLVTRLCSTNGCELILPRCHLTCKGTTQLLKGINQLQRKAATYPAPVRPRSNSSKTEPIGTAIKFLPKKHQCFSTKRCLMSKMNERSRPARLVPARSMVSRNPPAEAMLTTLKRSRSPKASEYLKCNLGRADTPASKATKRQRL
ncbi:uncharacterized protein LOC108674380 [Hyalella azteca]|uniref:Uncharacterized protein LOC108674380 n=1 Tax=Hyalella azteca TaxID=294128 RepID=A0A8B7NVK5_HYAAZ|nr:uncharacterized protein LOC108674380 [Hyalella azteca]